jgi:Ca2+-binding RTX toxin-like protein
MTERTFSAAKGTRQAMVVLACLAALAAVQAFSAKPASANPELISGGGGGEACPLLFTGVYQLSPTPITWAGTDSWDIKCGSNYADKLNGLGGDDKLYGEGGDDTLIGGTGNDGIAGAGGNDQIYLDAGTDISTGGAGDDTITGAAGDDDIFGGIGNDKIYQDDGVDEVYGNDGNDILVAAADGQPDYIDGSPGTDVLQTSQCNLESIDKIVSVEIRKWVSNC